MTTHVSLPRVHLGLHACQGPEGYLWHGLGRYVREHTLHLLRDHRELIAGLHFDRELPVPRTLGDFCGYGLLREYPPSGDGLFDEDSGADVFHVTSPLWPNIPLHRLIPSPFLRGGAKLVVTLYDLIPLIFEDQYLSDPWYRQWFTSRLKLIQEADHILALSITTRDDAVRLLELDPRRITVIYGGVSNYFRQADRPAEAVRTQVMSHLPEITGPYVLYPAGVAQFRKNIEGAIEAYGRLPQRLRETMQLVVIGYLPGPQRKVLEEHARKHGVQSRLVLPGFVTENLLRELYQACELCIYPSLYEGLGFPILEAMRCGAPVVTSDRSATKELVEIPEGRFDPEDPSEMAHVMERVLTDENLRRELIEYGLRRYRQFTWERVAQVTADCYREIGASMVQQRGWGIQQPVSRPIDAASGRDRSRNRKETRTRERKLQVCLSLRALQGPAQTHHRGWIRYVYEHSRQLLRDHGDLITGLHIDGELPVPKSLAEFCGYGLLQEYSSARQGHRGNDRIPDLFHIMSPFYPEAPLQSVFPPEFSRSDTKTMITLYDLIPLLLLEDGFLKEPRYRAWYYGRLRFIQDVDHVLTISKATANDAIRLLGLSPERVTVIYGGISDNFRPPDVPAAEMRKDIMRRVREITGRYILSMMFAYELGRRKNMEGVVEGYARLPQEIRRQFQLVFVGHGLEHDMQGLIQYARKNGVEDRLVLPGLVSDEGLRELYQGCDLFIYASRYEGLGLPILEAMRCGAPVIVSDRPAMNELIEMNDARFDPEDPADIAHVMERALTDAEFRRRLTEHGMQRTGQFTWERVAQVTADCYREVASPIVQRHVGGFQRFRSVAFCTSYPPEQSGAADYLRSLIGALCARHPVNVDVVVKGDPEAHIPPDQKAVSLISARQFRWLADHGHYDTIVYCMGNNSLHGYIYELLKERPGVVWLHDVRLTDFYRWYYRQLGRDLTTLPKELLPWARRYPDHQGDILLRDLTTQHEHGIYLAGEIASYAQRIVVNSRFAKELMEIESGRSVPVVALPFAAPAVVRASSAMTWAELASKYGLDEAAMPVVSVGSIGPYKCPEDVIDGFAAVASANRSLALAFVGPCEPEYQRQLERRAYQLEIKDRVLFTGYVEQAELDSWLAAARCAVQLRFPTNGQSSGSVMRCLAAGVPTIVIDHGPLRELPEDAVLKVPTPIEPARLAKALLHLVRDDQTCDGLRRGALRLTQETSCDAVADQFWTEVLCVR